MANVTRVVLEADSRQVRRATRDLNRMERQGTQTQRTVRRVGTALLAIGGTAAIARGIGALATQFKDAATEAESFRIRLNILLGSTREGGRAFEEMAKFAGQVPFEYREIMSAATQLAGVMRGGVDEINDWMPMIADLAAVSGLSIEKTTEQVVRMYSAGAGAADLFRERGITAMLGFEAGVSHSAEETRKKLIEAFEDPQSQFRGASQELANTWDGMLSMMSDSWFQFRNEFMQETVLWDFIKTALNEVRMSWADMLDANGQEMQTWASAVIDTIELIGVAFTTLWDVAMAPKRIFDALVALGETIVTEVLRPLNAIGVVSDEMLEAFAFNAEESRKNVERLNTTTSAFLNTMQEIRLNAEEAFRERKMAEALEELFASLRSGIPLLEEGSAATKAFGKASGDTAGEIEGELHPSIVFLNESLADFIEQSQQAVQRTEELRQGWEDELEVLRLRTTQGEAAAEVQEIMNRVRREGIGITRQEAEEYIQSRRALEDYIKETEAAAEQWGKIWDNAIEGMQREFGETIYNALWEDGIDSFGDFADAVVDIWKRMIAEMVAAWVTSGIIGLLSGKGFKGFEVGGLADIAKDFGAGEALKAGATKIGAALGIGSAEAAGISGASVTGGAAGAGLGGGGLGGGSAGLGGLGTGAASAGALAAMFVAFKALAGGPGPLAIAAQNFAGGQASGGALGLRLTQAQGNMFGAGPNAGFAASFAQDQGLDARRPSDIGQTAERLGIASFGGAGLEQVTKVLEEAQEAFEELKKLGSSTFKSMGVDAQQMGQILKDGVVDRMELARLGLENIGVKTVDAREGFVTLGDVSAVQFQRIMQAVDQGRIRLEALRGETMFNQTEIQLLGEFGLTAAELIATGFGRASEVSRESLRRLRDEGVSGFRDIEGAARAAADAASSVGSGGGGGGESGGESSVTRIEEEIRRQGRRKSFGDFP